MKVYIRSFKHDRRQITRYYVWIGNPVNHATNDLVQEPFYTRRQAERYVKKNNYDLQLKTRRRAI